MIKNYLLAFCMLCFIKTSAAQTFNYGFGFGFGYFSYGLETAVEDDNPALDVKFRGPNFTIMGVFGYDFDLTERLNLNLVSYPSFGQPLFGSYLHSLHFPVQLEFTLDETISNYGLFAGAGLAYTYLLGVPFLSDPPGHTGDYRFIGDAMNAEFSAGLQISYFKVRLSYASSLSRPFSEVSEELTVLKNKGGYLILTASYAMSGLF